jgi:hypothetical protein
MVYAAIKIGSVLVNLILSVVFLLYIPMFIANPNGFLSSVYVDNFQIGYIFLAIKFTDLCGLVSNYVYLELEDRY